MPLRRIEIDRKRTPFINLKELAAKYGVDNIVLWGEIYPGDKSSVGQCKIKTGGRYSIEDGHKVTVESTCEKKISFDYYLSDLEVLIRTGSFKLYVEEVA